MKTTFVMGGMFSLLVIEIPWKTWPIISSAVRFLIKPIFPVKQKAHPRSHPSWVETQSVVLSNLADGINTDSIICPSDNCCRNFLVPHADNVSFTTVVGIIIAFSDIFLNVSLAFSDKPCDILSVKWVLWKKIPFHVIHDVQQLPLDWTATMDENQFGCWHIKMCV